MRIVDLRSDTMTQPTDSMRRAMADAKVGDDVFGEDPSINRIEKLAAERMNKEAALYVASGTMANIVSLMTHCQRGDEMIVGDQAHIFSAEQGGSAALAGIHPRTLPNTVDGKIDLDHIVNAIRPDDPHCPRTRLIVLENTHNHCNGSPLEVDYVQSVGNIARKHNLKTHVDGARIFNAAIALGVEVSELVAPVDSVSFCLSKGLAAPVGSLVCGTNEFIARTRRARKVLGGGMRQAGVLAAAGIVALTEMVDRLAQDHANARNLAQGLAEISAILIDPAKVMTNIVFFEMGPQKKTSADLVERLGAEGIKILKEGPHKYRAVTHYHVTTDDIGFALDRFKKVLSEF
ncbi:MAG: low-specificity L-threonine aldolase [Desulfobacterales bacterium]